MVVRVAHGPAFGPAGNEGLTSEFVTVARLPSEPICRWSAAVRGQSYGVLERDFILIAAAVLRLLLT